MKKGQVAYEFLFVFFILALAFTVWVVFTSEVQSDFIDQKRASYAYDLALRIQEEAFIATEIEGTYTRTFDLPYDIHGVGYTVTINTYEISPGKQRTFAELEWESASRVFILPNSTGYLQGGENVISSVDGFITFNP